MSAPIRAALAAPTTAPPPASRRLTSAQVGAATGLKLGQLLLLRLADARAFDPTFPKMVDGTFSESEVMAWIAARNAHASHASTPDASLPAPAIPAQAQSSEASPDGARRDQDLHPSALTAARQQPGAK